MKSYYTTILALGTLLSFTLSHGLGAAPEVYVFSTLAGISADRSSGSVDGLGTNATFSYPAGVAIDKAGSLFVADSYSSVIRKLTLTGNTWTVTTFAGQANVSGSTDATGTNALFNSPTRLSLDGDSNLYVTDTGNHLIRKITSAGVVTTLAGRANQPGSVDGLGTNALFNYPTGLALDGANNLYVADSGNSTIRKISPAGLVNTLAGRVLDPGSTDAMGTNAQFNYPKGVCVDSSTNLYVADTQNNTIRKLSRSGADWVVTTLAGQARVSGSLDATSTNALFDNPADLTVDSVGNLYVTDFFNNTVRELSPAGLVTTLAGRARISGSVDGAGTNALFNGPAAISVDTAGNLFITDYINNTIREISTAADVTTLAGRASAGSNNGAAAYARFNQPIGLALDAATNLYVADTQNNTIRKITPGGLVSTLAGSPGLKGSADGVGTNARFLGPNSLAADQGGNLYVADTYNNTIRKITPAGVVATLAGSPGGWGSQDGTNAEALFSDVFGLALDGATNLYVTDTYNHLVRKITPVGNNWVVTTLAGYPGESGDKDASGDNARFNYPNGIALDAATNLYVADEYSHTIRKLTHTGAAWLVTTLAGKAGITGAEDGLGTNATFNYPRGIAVDSHTNLFVADARGYLIRKLSLNGAQWLVTTVGGQANRWGSSDGTAYHALFQTPSGITTDAVGNLYVADTLNNTLRLGTVHPTPSLHIVHTGATAVISWPSWAADFALQSTSGFSSVDYWGDISGAELSGDKLLLTNVPAASVTFYRLYLP